MQIQAESQRQANAVLKRQIERADASKDDELPSSLREHSQIGSEPDRREEHKHHRALQVHIERQLQIHGDE